MEKFTENATPLGLYDPQFEHDACGIGAVVDIKGRKSHQTVSDALSIVERLEHRAGKDAEGKTGDGVGIMLQISHKFFSKVADEMNISLGNEREYGVGMFFFPQNEHLRAQAMKLFELVTRKDDKPETVKNRLAVYHRETEPLKDFYRERGVLYPVEDMGPVEATSKAILAILRQDG